MKNRAKLNDLKRKRKFYDYLLIGLIVTFAFFGSVVLIRNYNINKASKDAKKVLESFKSLDDVYISNSDIAYTKDDTKIGGYKVIGSIKIESIGLEYPILDRTTPESLDLSITKLSGPKLNALGNVSLAGHHSFAGNLFGRLAMVNIGDIVEITDLSKTTLKYQVYKIYSVTPDNTSPLKTTDRKVRELTLVSCTQNGKKRIIVKALEVE